MRNYRYEIHQLMNVLRTRFFPFANLVDWGNFEKELTAAGAILAGGAINSIFSARKVNDLDFYVRDNAGQEILHHALESAGYKQQFKTDNAISFSDKNSKNNIQIITRFMGNPDYVLKSFDFTICQGAYDFKNEDMILEDDFLRDIARRKLVFTNTSDFPICAMYRMIKYGKRGYTYGGSTVVSVALAIHALKIDTYKDLKEQLLGVDTRAFQELTATWDSNKKFVYHECVDELMDFVFKQDAGDENDE